MIFRKLFVTALLVVTFVGVVQAQDRKAVREACRDDFRKFCAQVQPGGGRLLKCLREHDTELAAPCRDGLAGLKASR